MDESLIDIDEILKKLKKYKIVIIKRKDHKNEDFKFKYGFVDEEEKTIIKNLKKTEYIKSEPDKDARYSGIVHIFKTDVTTDHDGEVRVYIKFKILEEMVVVKTISFHEDEEEEK